MSPTKLGDAGRGVRKDTLAEASGGDADVGSDLWAALGALPKEIIGKIIPDERAVMLQRVSRGARETLAPVRPAATVQAKEGTRLAGKAQGWQDVHGECCLLIWLLAATRLELMGHPHGCTRHPAYGEPSGIAIYCLQYKAPNHIPLIGYMCDLASVCLTYHATAWHAVVYGHVHCGRNHFAGSGISCLINAPIQSLCSLTSLSWCALLLCWRAHMVLASEPKEAAEMSRGLVGFHASAGWRSKRNSPQGLV